MTRRASTLLIAIAALAALLAWSVSRENRPDAPAPSQVERHARSDASNTSHNPAGPGELLPKEFAIFQTHNAFGHGGAGPTGPEAMFVLRGVVKSGDIFTAFIQNIGDKQVARVTIGAPVARGLVKMIDLDSIKYEAAGDSRMVLIGQTLSGQPAPPTSRPAAQPPAPPGGPPGMPPQGGPHQGGMPPQMPPQMVPPDDAAE